MPAFSATLQFIKHAFEFFVYLSEDQSKLGANFFCEIRLVFFSPKTFVFAKIKTSFDANQNSVKRKAT